MLVACEEEEAEFRRKLRPCGAAAASVIIMSAATHCSADPEFRINVGNLHRGNAASAVMKEHEPDFRNVSSLEAASAFFRDFIYTLGIVVPVKAGVLARLQMHLKLISLII